MVGLPSLWQSRRLRPVPPALFLVCLAASAAACNVVPDEDQRLREGFPKYAAAVLERGAEIERTEKGFQAIVTGGSRLRLRGETALPARGDELFVFSPRGAGDVTVREVGLEGEGRVVDRAVTYRIPGGASFWSATAGGAEEWLLFEPGAVKPGRPAAIWEVAGATPVQRGEAIAIYTEQGRRVLTVTAPAAFLADGTDAPVRLSVRGSSIELFVETGGQAALVDPSWTYVASMNFPRRQHIARRLTSGDVIVAGGLFDDGGGQPSAIGGDDFTYVGTTTEIYSPVNDEWTLLDDLSDGHIEHAMVTVPGSNPPEGGVMVIAGRNDFGDFLTEVQSFEGFFWQFKAGLFEPRAAHTGTRLLDDRVLVAGGYNDCGGGGSGEAEILQSGGLIGSGFCFLCTAEVYDPAAASGSGAWLATGQLSTCRALHTETILDDGTVVVAGGEDPNGILASAERWSPATDSWVPIAPMFEAREFHTSTRLPDGKVLVTGGYDGNFPLQTAEVYDPVADSWTNVGPMQLARSRHGAVLLDDGTVLITGGDDDGNPMSSTEIYNPVTGQFSFMVNMNDSRSDHSTTLLLDGNVLVAGGASFFGFPPITSSAEIFSFLNLPGSPCVDAVDCASGFCADGVCCNTICDQPCEACTEEARGGFFPDIFGGGSGDGVGSGGNDGFCGPVYQGEDPSDDCDAEDSSTCGSLGECNGQGACEVWADGTICKVPICNGSTAEAGGLCDGDGTCVTGMDDDCDPYGCMDGVCAVDCDDPADCSPFAFCDGVVHLCAPKKPDGQIAFDPVQCVSGIIADGVCCDTPCDQACQACSKDTGASVDGICQPVSGVQCNDGDSCTQLDVCQAGVCMGQLPVECPGDVGCQGGLACDTKTGLCSIPTPPKNVGDPCNDGFVCTAGEVCTPDEACEGEEVECTPGECQSAGTCAEGVGCQFDGEPDYTSCTKDDNPCTIEWCISASCVPNNLTDFTPCPGGVCIGGSCIPDGIFNPSGPGAGGAGGTGGDTGGGGQGGGGSSAGGGPAGGAGGTGGNPAGNGDEAAFKLFGGGCSTSPSGSSSTPAWAGALALLGLMGARRRRASRPR